MNIFWNDKLNFYLRKKGLKYRVKLFSTGGGGLGCEAAAWYLVKGGVTRWCFFGKPVARIDRFNEGLFFRFFQGETFENLESVIEGFTRKTKIATVIAPYAFLDLYDSETREAMESRFVPGTVQKLKLRDKPQSQNKSEGFLQ